MTWDRKGSCVVYDKVLRVLRLSGALLSACLALRLVKRISFLFDSCHCRNRLAHLTCLFFFKLTPEQNQQRGRKRIGLYILLCPIRVITLFSLSHWLHLVGELCIFKRICSRKTGIAAVWENISSCFSLPNLPYLWLLVCISLIFLHFINDYLHFTGNNNNPPKQHEEESYSCEIRMRVVCRDIKSTLCRHTPPPHK